MSFESMVCAVHEVINEQLPTVLFDIKIYVLLLTSNKIYECKNVKLYSIRGQQPSASSQYSIHSAKLIKKLFS